jgi:hypothetical protein
MSSEHKIELMEKGIAVRELTRALRAGWSTSVAIKMAIDRLTNSGFGRVHSERTVRHALTLI